MQNLTRREFLKWASATVSPLLLSRSGISTQRPRYAARFFVAPNGNDANPGTKSRPWKTIDKAVQTINPGDTVILRSGIYLSDHFQFGPAGKDEKMMTVFKAMPGERVLLTRPDGTPPGVELFDYVRIEGIWIGGKWTKDEKCPIFALGGSPIGVGKQVVECTIFGYTSGILVGSSQHLLIQSCRIVHCGMGRFNHGIYLSGGYTKGAMTQHVIIDDNVLISGEGYAIHGWHKPHSCIITRNFVSDFFWGLVMDGSDHLVAHNTLWRSKGQEGREPGWNAWLPGERIVFVNNILNCDIPIFGEVGVGCIISHNAYLSGAPHPKDAKPFDLRQREKQVDSWIKRIDDAISLIDDAFNEPVERIYENKTIEQAFTVLRQPPPKVSGLHGVGMDIGLLPAGAKADIGHTVTEPLNFWLAFDKLGLLHFDSEGNVIAK